MLNSASIPFAILTLSLVLDATSLPERVVDEDSYCDDKVGLSLLQRTARVVRADNTVLESHGMETVSTTMLVISANTTAAEELKVSTNKVGDLSAFISALITNVVTIGICILFFSYMRKQKPWVYSANVYDDRVAKDHTLPQGHEKKESETFLGWINMSRSVSADECIAMCGLDHWMLLEFTHMSMKIMLTLAIPNLLIMAPLHCFAGGNRAGEDHLSWQGMANVVDGSQLYWGHCVVVWLSVIIVVGWVYRTMDDFMDKRKKWLLAMPNPRSNTILVNGIPNEYCSNHRLKYFFEKTLNTQYKDGKTAKSEGIITEAVCIYKTEALQQAIQKRNQLQELINVHEHYPDEPHGWCGHRKDQTKIDEMKEKKNEEIEIIKKQRADYIRINTDDQKAFDERQQRPGDAALPEEAEPVENFCNCGFVTFKERRDAEIAMKLIYEDDEAKFACEIPPDPADVIWHDFMGDETRDASIEALGWVCIGCLFLGYMPIIVGISSVASLETLREHVALFAHIIDHYPSLAAMWDGLVGALALTLMVGMIPTFLVIIFSHCFALRAQAWLQHKIQIWYYYFNVVFVLLVTAVGNSLLVKVEELAESPTSVFKLLASTMPTASHFYLNLFPTTWATHAMVLTRYVPLGKFTVWHKVFDHTVEEKVENRDLRVNEMTRDKIEPEDQDYYGMGSRSARFTIMLVIAITFCTLSPLMCVLALINSGLCRLFYGYLFNYAETVKSDLGGVFFVSQLKHLLQGLYIYIILMSGVLFYRGTDDDGNGPGVLPGIIAGLSFLFMIPAYNRFDRRFHWVDLPFSAIAKDSEMAKGAKRNPKVLSYKQPELMDEVDEKR
jgi:hypothetical protein